MLNNIFPFPVQAAVQAAAETPLSTPFEAAAAWVDDEQFWWLALNF